MRAGGASGRAPGRSDGGTVPRGGGWESFFSDECSLTCFSPFVRVGVVRLWHDAVHARARRHESRGVSRQLHVASISDYLVTTTAWVCRVRVNGKPIDMAAMTRTIMIAVTLYNAANAIRQHNTARSADYVAEKVRERVRGQSKSWRMECDDVSKVMVLVPDTQPLMGGWNVAPFLLATPTLKMARLLEAMSGRLRLDVPARGQRVAAVDVLVRDATGDRWPARKRGTAGGVVTFPG